MLKGTAKILTPVIKICEICEYKGNHFYDEVFIQLLIHFFHIPDSIDGGCVIMCVKRSIYYSTDRHKYHDVHLDREKKKRNFDLGK